MISSQASAHCVQWMHSICRPSRMSMPVGQVSTHAPQSMQSPAPCRLRTSFGARLAAIHVVRDDQRLPVEQHRLPPAVRTGDEARLLAKPGEVEHDRRGGERHDGERRRMLDGRSAHPDRELIDADEVGEEGVREKQREHAVHRVLREASTSQLPATPFAVQLERTAASALEQPLDGPEEKLHVHGLRTGPAAPHAAEQRREQEDR